MFGGSLGSFFCLIVFFRFSNFGSAKIEKSKTYRPRDHGETMDLGVRIFSPTESSVVALGAELWPFYCSRYTTNWRIMRINLPGNPKNIWITRNNPPPIPRPHIHAPRGCNNPFWVPLPPSDKQRRWFDFLTQARLFSVPRQHEEI